MQRYILETSAFKAMLPLGPLNRSKLPVETIGLATVRELLIALVQCTVKPPVPEEDAPDIVTAAATSVKKTCPAPLVLAIKLGAFVLFPMLMVPPPEVRDSVAVDPTDRVDRF